MTTLNATFLNFGLNLITESNHSISKNPTSFSDVMLASIAKGSKTLRIPSSRLSHYGEPIYATETNLRGYNRNWGGASSETQMNVMKLILDNTQKYSREDRALILGTVYIESGFNPDAAATSTSASGLFQFVDDTGKSFKINNESRFDALANLNAGLKLFDENVRTFNRKYSTLTDTDRAVRLYALHHDGPSLQYGGEKVAREKLVPLLPKFEVLVDAYDDFSDASASTTEFN